MRPRSGNRHETSLKTGRVVGKRDAVAVAMSKARGALTVCAAAGADAASSRSTSVHVERASRKRKYASVASNNV